ncbi:MAG: PilZ domain-containing protein [Desulfovibrionaceae bacterium]|nr:PilZ domain-containing protein [Desulfovibrionaceae bacterium]
MSEVERKDYVQVDVYVQGMMRIKPSPDDLPKFNGYVEKNKNLSELLAKSKLPEELLMFMEDMNSKLEHVIALLEHNRMEANFPMDIEVIKLSASGATFKTKSRTIAPGQTVEVVLPLSQLPLVISGGIGKIRRVDHPAHGLVWELSFTRIREQDMENIVQFVFQQERKRIREIRWEE